VGQFQKPMQPDPKRGESRRNFAGPAGDSCSGPCGLSRGAHALGTRPRIWFFDHDAVKRAVASVQNCGLLEVRGGVSPRPARLTGWEGLRICWMASFGSLEKRGDRRDASQAREPGSTSRPCRGPQGPRCKYDRRAAQRGSPEGQRRHAGPYAVAGVGATNRELASRGWRSPRTLFLISMRGGPAR
jgi:hypothetical protein